MAKKATPPVAPPKHPCAATNRPRCLRCGELFCLTCDQYHRENCHDTYRA